jgi:hypothetical protein
MLGVKEKRGASPRLDRNLSAAGLAGMAAAILEILYF